MREKPAEIRTAQLVLRPFCEGDREAFVSMVMDPKVSATFMVGNLQREKAMGLFDRMLLASLNPVKYIYALSFEGRCAGFTNYVAEGEINGRKWVEIGYVVGPMHWNRGFATEALLAGIEALFAMGYDEVRTGYFEGNEASHRVMVKAGMAHMDLVEEAEYLGQVHKVPFLHAVKGEWQRPKGGNCITAQIVVS